MSYGDMDGTAADWANSAADKANKRLDELEKKVAALEWCLDIINQKLNPRIPVASVEELARRAGGS
jgi:hypothetical protein